MAHSLQKFYSSFGGVDSRSNKLLNSPNTFRKGSKNFRYNFQDEIQKANGFQHKDNSAPSFVDIFEYKYRDVETGEPKSQVLGVSTDGNLYRKLNNTLTFISNGTATSYSVYYDEVNDIFKLDLNGLSSVSISLTMTLDDLKTALNAISGVSVDIIDDSGASVSSSLLAYCLDCVIDNDFKNNSVFYWEKVIYPSSTGIPFVTTRDYGTSSDYEGISYVNLNNSIYMTDGGFPMKYDGDTVCRVGMPRFTSDLLPVYQANFSNNYGGNLTGNHNYQYIQQQGYVNRNGDEILGKIVETNVLKYSPSSSDNGNLLQIQQCGNSDPQNDGFNVFSCQVDGDQTITGTGNVSVTVKSGHNLIPGMCLRIYVANSGSTIEPETGYSYYYAKISAVTATTITFYKASTNIPMLSMASDPYPGTNFYPIFIYDQSAPSTASYNYFPNNLVINGAYVPADLENTITEPVITNIDPSISSNFTWSPDNLYGAFTRVWRSMADGTLLYKLIDLPLSHQTNYQAVDGLNDTVSPVTGFQGGLTRIEIDYGAGDELPRACKYLALWQGLLVQAGRPVYPQFFLGKNYPFYYGTIPSVGNKWGQPFVYPPWTYQENNLCDFQSVYWASGTAPEGFPQDGLHEFAIDTEYSDKIKGIAPNKDVLFALKERSTGIISGDLGANSLTLEILEDDIGLASHRTLQEVKGSLVWLDPVKGFYQCVAGRLPVNIGFPISDYQQINAEGLDYSKSAAANARALNMYFCVVGKTWFVFDYSPTKDGQPRSCWYIWERFDCPSICFTSESELLAVGPSNTWKIKTTNTRFDFTDHVDAIEMNALTAWLTQGVPTIDKHWSRVWVNSIQGGFTLSIDQYGNYLDDLIGSEDITFPESPKYTVKNYANCIIPKLSGFSVGFRNAEKNKFVRIQGFEIEYSMDYDGSEPKQ